MPNLRGAFKEQGNNSLPLLGVLSDECERVSICRGLESFMEPKAAAFHLTRLLARSRPARDHGIASGSEL